MTDSPTPVQVSGLTNVTQIAAGETHSLALRADGTVWAWGQGGIKQLGDGNIADSPTPVQVSGLTNVTRIAAGRYHNLAGRADGTVWAWGWNFYGQLGNGSNGDSSVPVLAPMVNGECLPVLPMVCPTAPDVQALAAGSQHSLVQRSDLYVWGWGDNFRGQIGDSIGAAGRNSPGPLGALLNGTGFRQFAAGSEFNMALKMDGTILMWGTNAQEVLGVNLGASSTPTPTAIPTLSGVTQVTAGFEHALALKSDGTVWGWGRNTYGQVTGSYSIVSTPAQTGFQSGAFLTGVQRIGAGVAASHTLVLKQDGTVWSFGHDGNCKLGRGCTGTTFSRDPVQVVGLLLF
jgi:alpha-tubulin suppressor-like RCC1 family protein